MIIKIKMEHNLDLTTIGNEMYEFVKRLFPICRSITGHGLRKTLTIIQEHIPIKIYEVPTETIAFDWTVPKEWNIKDAWVMDEDGNKLIDFKKNNLHVVGYSVPVNKTVNLSELQEHLYSLPDQPQAIPYVTSYYEERWGFCITQKEREKLKKGTYKVFIDSELRDGSLTYGELIIPGKSEKEVFLSTYVCHPSMANNELSGPAVTTFLVKWILSKPRKYTYRVIFIPETIGSIVYLSKNAEEMKRRTVAGFVVTCVGDENAYSFLPSRSGNTLGDRVARHVLDYNEKDYRVYTFLDRGSDERQYCSPGIDLPVVSILRSKYGAYPEYHTSLDDLSFVTPKGLAGGYVVLRKALEILEENETYRVTVLCEPQLSKRGIYPTLSGSVGITSALSQKSLRQGTRDILNILAYSDGKYDLLAIAELMGVHVGKLFPIARILLNKGLLVVA